MAELWTDILDPATLTGYARESMSDVERRKGTLAGFLPNRTTPDTLVRFNVGRTGLVEEARFRAYDAEPEVGRGPKGERRTLELPAIGQTIPVSEYNQIRGRNSADPIVAEMLYNTADQVVTAVSDRIERLRGQVLLTGKAVIDQDNFQSSDDFGRSEKMAPTAATAWNDPDADPIRDLRLWRDLYEDTNGVEPGAMVWSREIQTALANSRNFQITTAGGGSRPATMNDVNAILASEGLPPIYVYTRRTASGPVLPKTHLLMLPPQVGVDDWMGTELGATFWGQTLTAEDPAWNIAPLDRPGIVVGAYRNPKPPMIAEIISDAISIPVLANADLALAAKVL